MKFFRSTIDMLRVLLCFLVAHFLQETYAGTRKPPNGTWIRMGMLNELMHTDRTPGCEFIPGLSSGQSRLCHLYQDHMHVVAIGAQQALIECKHQFQHMRWNCSLEDNVNVFGPVVQIASRETAFAYALASAGVTYSVARACKDSQLSSCGCARGRRPKNLRKEWIWGGCGDNLEYGYKYAKANNKYMPDYDPALPSTYLMYYDINAMYSWAMSQSLPTGGLEWVEDAGNLNFHVPDDNPEGYILEVDLEYPQHIHDRQRDLPMGPTKQRSPGSAYEKMLATLYSKEKYVVHYRNLKQYLAEGIRVTKIHRALRFKQSPWLKPYIDLNTTLRQGARNEFEKNLFKLMNNAVFGKTMENVRLRRNIKIVDKWDGRYGAEALISRPNFKCSTIFNDN